MDQKIKDYWKCVYANKATLSGYLLSAAGLGYMGLSDDHSSFMDGLSITSIGMNLLLATSFGFETLLTYKKSKRYIQEFGKVRENYREIKKEWYCSRVGIKLAAKEAGLEVALKK